MLIKRRKRGRGGVDSWEVVRARGHLDEVQELKSGEAALALAQGRPSKESMQLVLTEGAVLGGGAFSRVSIVTGCLLACLLACLWGDCSFKEISYVKPLLFGVLGRCWLACLLISFHAAACHS